MAVNADILMITYNRSEYTRKSLPCLLENCPPDSRVWIWQNGSDPETLDIVKSYSSHPRVAAFKHSKENVMLRTPTNWFWASATGRFLGKVDDDCLVPENWIEQLAGIHDDEPKAGVISCWPFLEEDYREDLATKKTITLRGDHKLMLNCWTGGSGYLIKRAALEQNGPLGDKESFSQWCTRLMRRGWLNGWPFPFLFIDHMDDPLSPNTLIRSEADFQMRTSLSSRRFGTSSYEEFCQQARLAALEVQKAKPQPLRYSRLATLARHLAARISNKSWRRSFLNP